MRSALRRRRWAVAIRVVLGGAGTDPAEPVNDSNYDGGGLDPSIREVFEDPATGETFEDYSSERPGTSSRDALAEVGLRSSATHPGGPGRARTALLVLTPVLENSRFSWARLNCTCHVTATGQFRQRPVRDG
jgi:hypothetical protein